jgi:hypothetical protein
MKQLIALLMALLLFGCVEQKQATDIPPFGYIVLGVANATCNYRNSQTLPNPNCTPGATNPNVTQDNIKETICVSGYTATIRPPTSYTNKLKAQQLIDYGFPDANMSSVEEDHLIPLSVGGNPTDPKNLWPEPWEGEYGARKKDVLERRIQKMVCNGSLSLEEGQLIFQSNWIEAYDKYYS